MKQESIRKDFFDFLKNPSFKESFDSDILTNIKILFKVLILTYIGLFILALLFGILEYFEIVSPIRMKINKIYDFINENHSDYKPYFLLQAILIYPIIEEVSFRLPLTKYNKRFIQISISVLGGQLITFLIKNFLWWPSSSLNKSLISMCYFFAIGLIIFISLYFSAQKHFENLAYNWNRKPKLIFFTSASLFAILHIINLDLKLGDLFFLPLILLPFFIFGIVFGYLRIRLGFLYSIALHVLINGIRFIEIIKH